MSQWNPCRSRGASSEFQQMTHDEIAVSVEPLPKQGCEYTGEQMYDFAVVSQWNPCRSRGASARRGSWLVRCGVSVEPLPKQGCEWPMRWSTVAKWSLSGTPAEAGVRDGIILTKRVNDMSQWNPCRSRGARTLRVPTWSPVEESQWNPCRSRGASPESA